jgi:two-component system response regulator FixJ
MSGEWRRGSAGARAGGILRSEVFEYPIEELSALRAKPDEQAAAPASPQPRLREARDIFDLLSPRQRRVLQGILAGNPNKAIAFDLGVSIKTVETHRARLMVKLQADSLAELVRICTVAGIR